MRDEKKYKKYKSDTKTNRPESALSENIKLIDFRTFVHPKIRTLRIRTKNPYHISVPKTRTENLYIRTYHQRTKNRNSVKVEISQNNRETIAKMITRVITGFL